MDILGTSANIASLLCLPATIAAIPGVAMMFSPMVRDFIACREWLPWVILLTLVIGIAVDVSAHMRWMYRTPPLIPVNDVTFDNEAILLDGHSYYKCIFKDVKFIWNGGDFVITSTKMRLRSFRHIGAAGLMRLEVAQGSSCKRYRILAMRLRLKSRKISRAALWPGAPVTPPPGWPPEPHK
jgi:hypothetical protein